MTATLESPAPASAELDLEQLFLFVMALRGGDFGARLDEHGKSGRAEEIARHLNRFAEQMQKLTSEIARVSDEVAHGTLGGSVDVLSPPGPWKNCVDSFNGLQWAITGQLRDFIKSAKLIAQGDLSRKVTVNCQGETQELKTALNATIDRLRAEQAKKLNPA